MVLPDLIEELHCPYCGSGFDQEMQLSCVGSENYYGVIRCACYRYPVIDGIPILKQLSGPADILDKGVEYLEAGNAEGALYWALSRTSPIFTPRTGWRRVIDFLGRTASFLAPNLAHLEQRQTLRRLRDESLTFQQALLLLRPAAYAQYLFHRYANNSFLASLAILLLLKELDCRNGGAASFNSKKTNATAREDRGEKRRVLDLACGVGHASFLIKNLFPRLSVVAADHDFINLFIARHYLIPDVTCICIDAEIPLPFADNSFDAVFCLDGFHYLRSKVALLSELNRTVQPLGLWLFPHLHNALAYNISSGIPLRPADYLRCFDFIQARLFPESEIFRNFMHNQNLDLERAPSDAELRSADVFSLVGSRRTDIWRKHRDITSILWRDKSHLTINPIYQVTNQEKTMRLRMVWPNAILEKECAPVKNYLPPECEINRLLWERLKNGVTTTEDESGIQTLIRSFILVWLPQTYGGFSAH